MRDISPTDWPNEDLLMELIERGQREGAFASDLSVSWIEHTLCALVPHAT